MAGLNDKSKVYSAPTTKGQMKTVPCLLAVLAGIGCAATKPPKFTPRDITRIEYDSKNCHDIPGGKVRCKDVDFTLGKVDVKELQREKHK